MRQRRPTLSTSARPPPPVVDLLGTSNTSPHATGPAALLAQGLGNNAEMIRNSAGELGERGADPFYGKGRIDLREALG